LMMASDFGSANYRPLDPFTPRTLSCGLLYTLRPMRQGWAMADIPRSLLL